MKPLEIRRLEGNRAKRPLSAGAPTVFAAGVPKCPSFVPAVGRREWKRITEILDAAGVLTEVDQVALADRCLCYARLVELERAIWKTGIPLLEGRKGENVKHPLSAVLAQYRRALQTYDSMLGLVPAARVRLDWEAGKKSSERDDPIARAIAPRSKTA